jgi:hypothetical protein
MSGGGGPRAAGGCCGCLLLVLLLAGGLAGGLYVFTQGAAEGARATLRQIKSGDLDAAYAGLAPSLKAEMSRDEFGTLVERHPGLKNNADATFWSRSVTNDRATLNGVLTPEGGGTPERVTIQLQRDGGVWKISRLKFEDSQEGRAPGRPRAPAA